MKKKCYRFLVPLLLICTIIKILDFKSNVDFRYISLQNSNIAIHLSCSRTTCFYVNITNNIVNRTLAIDKQLFRINIDLPSCELNPIRDTSCLLSSPFAIQQSKITLQFSCFCSKQPIILWWEAELHSTFLRIKMRYESSTELNISNFEFATFDAQGISREGKVRGSVLFHEDSLLLFGTESPLSMDNFYFTSTERKASLNLPHPPVNSISTEYSAIFVSLSNKRLKRREFSKHYLDKVRSAMSRENFLHYNSWFDFTSWQPDQLDDLYEHEESKMKKIVQLKKMDERGCIDRINSFGKEFLKRNISLRAFLWDDGWDDPNSLWKFHSGFPNGFSKLSKVASTYGSKNGVWLSPFGGYGLSRITRLKAAASTFKIDESGFSLLDKKYFNHFLSIANNLVDTSSLKIVKIDGVTLDEESPLFSAQHAALNEFLNTFRGKKRDEGEEIWINLTSGTWPSVFFLLEADSIWRGYIDLGFHGFGSPRQRWINFRDAILYKSVVQRAPLFPLNALMHHGIVAGNHGQSAQMGLNHLNTDADMKDFSDEVFTYFALGAKLQELYLSDSVMNTEAYDIIASAKIFSDRNSALADMHFVKGNPIDLEPYVLAGFDEKTNCGVISIRNPSAKKENLYFTLNEAFDLEASNETVRLKCIFGEKCSQVEEIMQLDEEINVILNSKDVIVIEVTLLSKAFISDPS